MVYRRRLPLVCSIRSTQRSRKEQGLGLAISQQIVEEHGGTIDVDVTETQGATFIVTLSV